MGSAVLAVVAAIALGLAIGVLSGLLGIGGGTLMVPAFRLLFGMSALASTATSLFTIIPTSISGFVSHVRNRTCIPKLGVAMGLGGAITSPIGVWLAQQSPSWAVMLAAALVIGYSAYTMLKKAMKAPKGAASSPAKAHGPSSQPEFAEPEIGKKQLGMGFAIGIIAGVLSGYVGVGGGFLMVPLMLSIIGLPMKKASGTSLVAIILLAIPGVVEHGILGNIDYTMGLAVAVGTIPGAFFGARMVSRVPERTLRFLFAAFLGVGAMALVANEFVSLA